MFDFNAYHRAKYKESPWRWRFNSMKRRIARKGLNFELSYDEYRTLVLSKLCHYCGDKATGLDRLNNSIGYIRSNVVPSCAECNYARKDLFSVEEMLTFIGPAIALVKKQRVLAETCL